MTGPVLIALCCPPASQQAQLEAEQAARAKEKAEMDELARNKAGLEGDKAAMVRGGGGDGLSWHATRWGTRRPVGVS